MSTTRTRDREKPSTVHRCGGCGASWTPLGAAHCSACHATFSTSRLFDLHRVAKGERGTCLDPDTVTNRNGQRLLFWRDGMWRGPELTDEQRARWGRGAT